MNRALSQPPIRAPGLDRARGVAVLAMVVYHLAWDLSHFGLIEADVGSEPGWRLFAQAIAGSFLFIVGISLHLATTDGLDGRAFLSRLGKIAGAAALVTAATLFAFPQSYIAFGILHCIAASSVLALAFRTLPPPLTALAGAAMIVLPQVFRSPAFDATAWLWLGLGATPPRSNDYVPMFPWAGYVLLGLAAGKMATACVSRAASGRSDPLAWLGRRSLAIYLIHQPLLFGALLLAVQSGALPDRKAESSLTRSCAIECQIAGAQPSLCATACRCATAGLRGTPFWPRVLEDSMSVEERRVADAIGRACYAETLRARKP